jgi:ubiquinone/menaquinone biosynthesis C-methylase UbiE
MIVHSAHAQAWQLESNSAEAYERYLAAAFSPWADALTAAAELKAGERALDVACGTGIVARHAARRVGAGGTVVGLDLNDAMLTVARAVTAGSQPSIEWRQGDVTRLPFPDRHFDAVFCEQALQFFPEPLKALREMRRVLADGGRAAISVCRPLEFCPAYVALADALERFAGAEAAAMMRSPFSRWRVAELKALAGDAGFARVSVRIEVASLRYPSASEFLRREAASSPLAPLVGTLDANVRAELVRELESALGDHTDDEGVVCGVESYVALCHV